MANKNNLIKGKTTSGFPFTISKNTLNDMRIVEAIGMLDKDPTKIAVLVRLVLGDEQTEKLYKHVEEKDKTVPIDKVSDVIFEIFQSVQELKNS